MPSQNVVSANQDKLRGQKRDTNVVKRNLNQIEEIPSKSEKNRRRRYLIAACVILGIIAAIIIAGLLPALIVKLTQNSTSDTTNSITTSVTTIMTNSNTTNSITNSVATTVINNNTTTGSSVTTSSSINNSTNSVTAGVNTLSTTFLNGFTAGGALLSSSSAWYAYEEVTVSCSSDLINITIVITVQKTVNATYRGSFSTFWSGTVNQGYIDNGTEIIYTWTIISGQTISASGSPYRAQAQFNLFGVNQTTSADTYIVTATTVTGITSTQSGHF